MLKYDSIRFSTKSSVLKSRFAKEYIFAVKAEIALGLLAAVKYCATQRSVSSIALCLRISIAPFPEVKNVKHVHGLNKF